MQVANIQIVSLLSETKTQIERKTPDSLIVSFTDVFLVVSAPRLRAERFRERFWRPPYKWGRLYPSFPAVFLPFSRFSGLF